ncbi:MAG: penicillin-binding protein 2 [Acidithiobacillus sp.]|nr:penicillin-binding protein 2 [Acidithiobacillus sp.]
MKKTSTPLVSGQNFRNRLGIAAIVVLLLLLVVLARLLDLQVLHYQKFRQLAHDNHIALVPVNPPRGLILADHGQILAKNQPTYAVEVTPDQTSDLHSTLDRLQKLLDLSDGDMARFDKSMAAKASFDPIILKANLSPQQVAALAVRKAEFPGVRVTALMHRNYPFGTIFSHIVGYVGPITATDLKRHQAENYRGRDYVGKTGLESYYEQRLRGQMGYQIKQINAEGLQVGTLEEQEPLAGDNLVTHLRLRVQEAAANALESNHYRGAVVALDPNNGHVLAMVSSPSFDANWFVDGISTAHWRSLLDNPGHPLTDRADNGLYPPGSCAKPFFSIQAIQSGVIGPDFRTYCPGNFQLGGHTYWDWNRGGFGETNLTKALAWSVDVFYYKLAVKMGIQLQDQTLWRFGFGKSPGIDLPGGLAGLVPTPQWKRARLHAPWYTGDSVILGIGQGYLLVTPLQLARAVSAIANGGYLVQPQVAKEWVNSSTGERSPIPNAVPENLHIDPVALHAVRQGMEACVNTGTCHTVSIPGISIAGKTGTAQIPEGYAYGRTIYNNDSLFIGWAPVDHPKIAVAVVVENGGHNAWQALPVARATIAAYLQPDRDPGPPLAHLHLQH